MEGRKFEYFKEYFLTEPITRPIERVYIHTVAVRGVSSIISHDDYHRNVKGWDGFAYHEYIKKTGEVQAGRDPNAPGSAVLGDNANTYHITFEGHGDYESWSAAQWKAMVPRCISIMQRAKTKDGRVLLEVFRENQMHLLGHREVNFLVRTFGWATKYNTLKTCPGLKVDMPEVRRRVWEALPK